jgi:hypothetical protein
LLLLLVPAAVVLKRSKAPEPPAPTPVVKTDESVRDESASEEVVFSPPPAAAPAPAAPAEEPAPEPVKPRVDEMRLSANQVAACATCRNACSAQAQFQACAVADEDNDGTGEFGTFGEMSAGTPLRGAGRMMNPPVLSRAFKAPDRSGRVKRNGYVYAIFLPGPAGRPIAERSGGGVDGGQVDADLAETRWCMYAWPEEYGVTGRLTYFVNQTGDVTATDCSRYSGDSGPSADAAFKADPTDAQARGTILGNVAIGQTGQDGNRWKQVN